MESLIFHECSILWRVSLNAFMSLECPLLPDFGWMQVIFRRGSRCLLSLQVLVGSIKFGYVTFARCICLIQWLRHSKTLTSQTSWRHFMDFYTKKYFDPKAINTGRWKYSLRSLKWLCIGGNREYWKGLTLLCTFQYLRGNVRLTISYNGSPPKKWKNEFTYEESYGFGKCGCARLFEVHWFARSRYSLCGNISLEKQNRET